MTSLIKLRALEANGVDRLFVYGRCNLKYQLQFYETNKQVAATAGPLGNSPTLDDFGLTWRSEWLDSRSRWREDRPPNLYVPDRRTRSDDSCTYADCVNWEYSFDTKAIKITVFEGDNYSGVPTTPRCAYYIEGPVEGMLKAFTEFSDEIHREFTRLVAKLRQEELEAIEVAAHKRIAASLLSKHL